MIDSLVKSASSIFFGSTVGGVGFSFGRDIYKKIKKNLTLLIAVVIFLGCLIAPYLSAKKIFQWYPVKNIKWCLLVFFPWFLLCVVSLAILLLYGSALFPIPDEAVNTAILGVYPITQKGFLIVLLMWIFLFVVGMLNALYKRPLQKAIFLTEEYNESFLERNGIEEVDGGNSFSHIDEDGNMLRLVSMGADVIVFMAIGKRSKRAFITIGDDGRFKEYSGVVSI